MELKYFDSHSHLNFSQYDKDREEVIKEMQNEGFATICVGTSQKTSEESVDLATKHEHIWATIGIHPTDVEEFNESVFEKMITDRVVGVGECGLDYFREKNRTDEDKERQRELFRSQIEFALKHDLPLMIHCRPSSNSMDAYRDALDILEEYKGKVRGNSHFFVGNAEIAQRFLDLGFTIAFPGVITFTQEYDSVVKMVPLDMILSETDAPFASPDPYRGQRNNPVYVKEVISAIAILKGEEEETVRKATISNARRVFGIQ